MGSSRMKKVRPVSRRASSVASFTRWFSPPGEGSTTAGRGLIYPRPMSASTCSLRAIFGIGAKKSRAWEMVMSSIGYRLAFIAHLKSLSLVALAATRLAWHEEVGEEVHLDGAVAIAATPHIGLRQC